jgi:hypothetical protein
MVTAEFAKVLVEPLEVIFPPLIFNAALAPPKLLLPLTMTSPALRVKLLPAARALPWAPMFHVPDPLFVII